VKQKALFLHVAKRNRALLFCNPVTGHVILLFEVQKQTKDNFKYYISDENLNFFHITYTLISGQESIS